MSKENRLASILGAAISDVEGKKPKASDDLADMPEVEYEWEKTKAKGGMMGGDESSESSDDDETENTGEIPDDAVIERFDSGNPVEHVSQKPAVVEPASDGEAFGIKYEPMPVPKRRRVKDDEDVGVAGLGVQDGVDEGDDFSFSEEVDEKKASEVLKELEKERRRMEESENHFSEVAENTRAPEIPIEETPNENTPKNTPEESQSPTNATETEEEEQVDALAALRASISSRKKEKSEAERKAEEERTLEEAKAALANAGKGVILEEEEEEDEEEEEEDSFLGSPPKKKSGSTPKKQATSPKKQDTVRQNEEEDEFEREAARAREEAKEEKEAATLFEYVSAQEAWEGIWQSDEVREKIGEIVKEGDDGLGPVAGSGGGFCGCFGGGGVVGLTREVEEERDAILCVAKCAFDPRNRHHIAIMESMYKAVSGSERGGTRLWGDIGFQSEDFARDLRGMGMWGPMQLMFFAEEYPSFVRQSAWMRNSHAPGWYPLVPQALNVSKHTIEAMRTGRLNRLAQQHHSMLRASNMYFTALFALWLTDWRAKGAKLDLVGPIRQRAAHRIAQNPTRAIQDAAPILDHDPDRPTVTETDEIVSRRMPQTSNNQKGGALQDEPKFSSF